MKTYRAQVGQRGYNVSVQESMDDLFQITIDDRIYELRPHRTGEIITWTVTSRERSSTVLTRVEPGGRITAWVAGLPFDVILRPAGTVSYARIAESSSTAASEIRAVMPGRITSILVKAGDDVEFGTPVLILEAMKMQNEISSPVHGRIKSVRVSEGESVKKGSLLVEVEADIG